MNLAYYPGSFNPIHNGHLAIIDSIVKSFDKVVVGVAENSSKLNNLFTYEQRLDLVKSSLAGYKQVSIVKADGLTVNMAESLGACCIIKGLRSNTDFDEEMLQAKMNNSLNPKLSILFVPNVTDSGLISSRYIREVFKLGGDISNLVPEPVNDILLKEI